MKYFEELEDLLLSVKDTPPEDLLDALVGLFAKREPHELYRCRNCRRLLIFWRDKELAEFYIREDDTQNGKSKKKKKAIKT